MDTEERKKRLKAERAKNKRLDPEHRAKLIQQCKDWKAANQEKVKTYNKTYRKKYYEENREKIAKINAVWKTANHDRRVAKNSETLKLLRAGSPNVYMWRRSRAGAKRRGIEFSISPEDIVVPDVCPLLGTKLIFGSGRLSANSPSLDRFDNTKGYVKGNVWVVSHKANTMKGTASISELKMFCEVMLKQLEEWHTNATN